jgi:dTDP-4-dehydrorhamnose 3,5-epimerase
MAASVTLVAMHIRPLSRLPDVALVELDVHRDDRGFFVERWREDVAERLALPAFVQENHSRSTRGTLRGLHYQAPPHAQAKLVSVVRGEVFDVVVDLRAGSPTYGRWDAATLSGDSPAHLWVPAGFAHGFLVTSDVADVVYKVDAGYAPGAEGGLRWDDPDLAIPWPTGDTPLTSVKDARWPAFSSLPSPFA